MFRSPHLQCALWVPRKSTVIFHTADLVERLWTTVSFSSRKVTAWSFYLHNGWHWCCNYWHSSSVHSASLKFWAPLSLPPPLCGFDSSSWISLENPPLWFDWWLVTTDGDVNLICGGGVCFWDSHIGVDTGYYSLLSLYITVPSATMPHRYNMFSDWVNGAIRENLLWERLVLDCTRGYLLPGKGNPSQASPWCLHHAQIDLVSPGWVWCFCLLMFISCIEGVEYSRSMKLLGLMVLCQCF